MKALSLLALIGVCLASRPVEEGLAPLAQDTPEDVPHDQCGVSAILNDDERLELFGLGFDDHIHHRWQSHDGSWSNWVSLGGNFSTNAQAVRNIDGRIEIFSIGKDDQLYHNWQQTNGGAYQDNWVPLGGPFSGSPSVLLNSEGNIVIFARGKISRSLMYNHQVHNATAVFWAGWSNLGGILTSGPSSVLTAESMVHVFVRGVDKGLFEKKQVATHSGTVAWSKFEGLGGLLASHPSVPAALNPVNLLEIFVRQADRAIWYKRQTASTYEADSVAWSEWQSLGGKMSSGPSVVINNDGLIEVYARGMDSQIYTRRQLDHDSVTYSTWETLQGESSSTPSTLLHPDGSLHLFYRGNDKQIYHKNKKPISGISGNSYQWSAWSALKNSDGSEASFQLFYC
jgi:hypothetical protein